MASHLTRTKIAIVQ